MNKEAEIINRLDALEKQFQAHEHSGIDGKPVSAINLTPYKIAAAVPSYAGYEGEIVLVNDGSSTFAIAVYLNGAWKSVAVA